MKKIVFVILFATAAALLIAPRGTSAFPGGTDDENCDAQREASAQALAAGQDVAEPDCIADPGASALEMRAAYAAMSAPQFTDVRQIEIRDDILYQRRYRRIITPDGSPVVFYDGPGGNPVGSIDNGYNYVSIRQVTGGWVQLTNGQWVPEEHTRLADVSGFAGIEILEEPTLPYAWMVRSAYPSSFPGGPENRDLPRISQYTLLAIYTIEVVDGWEWYMVGPGQWLQQTRVAKLKPVERPEGVDADDFWIAVDLFEQTLVAYEGDQMVFATLISSGLPQWSTNEGLFQVYIRAVSSPMTGASGQPEYYFIENIPWVMYFDNDIALHGAYWHDLFGYRQSRGCVNLSIMDSWWVYRWSEGAENKEPWVYVYSSDEYRDNDLPAWARRPRS